MQKLLDIAICLTILHISAGTVVNLKSKTQNVYDLGRQLCTTLNGGEGNCILIFSCPSILNSLASLDEEQFKLVKKSQCGFHKYPLVCCPIMYQNLHKDKNTIPDLLPSRKFCGYQHTDDYYIDQKRTNPNIDEFPWLASLLHLDATTNNSVILCSATLISDKYLLTAAHCVATPHYILDGARLGDYNLGNDKDCAENAEQEDCTEPVKEYAIAQVKVHPEYSSNSKKSDIALLRLNQSVVYSDFIRPICLPLPGTKLANVGDTVSVTGWGTSILAGKEVNIKKRILAELKPVEDCIRGASSRFKITNKHSCTISKSDFGDLSCEANSGGPVMFSNKNQWHLEGVTSVGGGCGIEQPVINTNIASYVQWIMENMKA